MNSGPGMAGVLSGLCAGMLPDVIALYPTGGVSASGYVKKIESGVTWNAKR